MKNAAPDEALWVVYNNLPNAGEVIDAYLLTAAIGIADMEDPAHPYTKETIEAGYDTYHWMLRAGTELDSSKGRRQ